MVVYRYAPKGKDAPPPPPLNVHTFAYSFDAYVRGAAEIGKVSSVHKDNRPRLSAIYG